MCDFQSIKVAFMLLKPIIFTTKRLVDLGICVCANMEADGLADVYVYHERRGLTDFSTLL